MASSPLRRWLSASVTGIILAVVLALLGWQQPPEQAGKVQATPLPEKFHTGLPLFGGSVQRNMVNLVERNMPTTWNTRPGEEKNIKWSVELGSNACGGPVVSGGKIFIGTNNDIPRDPKIKGDKGILMCFRESDGKFLWQAVHDKLPEGNVYDWPKRGIASTPVVDGNRLYYVSNRSEVVCADIAGNQATGTARILWTLDMIRELGVIPHTCQFFLAGCSPLIVGDTLFVITGNGVDEKHIDIPAPEAPSFLAIDKKTGRVLWKDNSPSAKLANARRAGKNVNVMNLANKGEVLMHGQWTNPVYADPNGKPMIIFPGGDGWIRAFHPASGQLLWKFDCNPKGAVKMLGPQGTRNDFVSTPVVWENKLYIGVGQDPEHDKGVGHLWCIDITKEPKNPEMDLSPVNDNFHPKAAVNKDSGLVWHFGGKIENAPDGRDYLFGRTLSTCAVHDGLCYAAEYDGVLHCLDAHTGQQHWEHDMDADIWASPFWVDGKVYIGTEDGKVLIFEHGRTKKKIAEIDMRPTPRGGRIRSSPVAANGVLYLVTENPCKLYAITKK